jgi:hypothetical protein
VISWSESIDVDRPSDQVYPALHDQHTLMRWSAWPKATGYARAVDGDGTSTGSSIVFTAPSGEGMGRQTIAAVTATSVLQPFARLFLARRIRLLHRKDLKNLKELLKRAPA